MPLAATLHRHVFHGAHERIARLAAMLCRLGVLLAIIQLGAWGVVSWLHADTERSLEAARHESRLAAVDAMVSPSLAALVRADQSARAGAPDPLERLMTRTRETSRTLLWGIAVVLVPLVIAAGMMAPFIREVDATRVLFGMVAVLGLIPLASAEAPPDFLALGLHADLPAAALPGLAAPLVAAVLLAAAAILVAPSRAKRIESVPRQGAPRISPLELKSIIHRGEHPGPDRIRSSRSRRTAR